jgi:putative membrane protein
MSSMSSEDVKSTSEDAPASVEQAEYRGEALAVRSIFGGTLMGLANLVPGISGGTMLLAAGVYPQFISGVAEVSTFRFRAKTVLMLACVIGAAAMAIITLAGPISEMVVSHRWMMYSIFIGLTLGGVPILWRMIRPADPVVVISSIIGIAFMAIIALLDPGEAARESASLQSGIGVGHVMLFIAGLVAGAAMILPGLSGGYLLLVLGQYVVILSAIAAAREAVGDRDMAAMIDSLHVFIPVGIGVLVGVVGVSNIVKLLLERFERPTLGLLLGLLLGAVIGLWPFQDGVPPEVGTVFKGDIVAIVDGELVLEETGRAVKPKDWVTEPFSPSGGQLAGAVGLVLAGLLVSVGVGRLGSGKNGSRHVKG